MRVAYPLSAVAKCILVASPGFVKVREYGTSIVPTLS